MEDESTSREVMLASAILYRGGEFYKRSDENRRGGLELTLERVDEPAMNVDSPPSKPPRGRS